MTPMAWALVVCGLIGALAGAVGSWNGGAVVGLFVGVVVILVAELE